VDPFTRLVPGRGDRAAAERFDELLERRASSGALSPDEDRALRLAEQLGAQGPALPAAPAEFRDALRTRLLAVAAVQGVGEPAGATRPATVTAPGSRRVPRTVTVAVGAMASLVAVGGVAAAGTQSLPGDPFYGVKRTVEAVQLATADGAVERGGRHLALAEERLDEVRGLVLGRDSGADDPTGELRPLPADDDRDQQVVETLEAMDDQVRRADELLTGAHRSAQGASPLQSLSDFSDAQAAELARLLPVLPAASREQADASLALVTAVGAEARALLDLAGCRATCVPAPGVPDGSAAPGCDCPPATGTPGGPQGPVAPPAPGTPPVPAPGEQPAPGAPAPGGPAQPGPRPPSPTPPAPGLPLPGLPSPQPLPTSAPLPIPLPLPLPLPTTVPLPGDPLPLPEVPLPDVPLPLPSPLPTTLLPR
jgi:hypothetical protein